MLPHDKKLPIISHSYFPFLPQLSNLSFGCHSTQLQSWRRQTFVTAAVTVVQHRWSNLATARTSSNTHTPLAKSPLLLQLHSGRTVGSIAPVRKVRCSLVPLRKQCISQPCCCSVCFPCVRLRREPRCTELQHHHHHHHHHHYPQQRLTSHRRATDWQPSPSRATPRYRQQKVATCDGAISSPSCSTTCSSLFFVSVQCRKSNPFFFY